jgi:site-specific recombinase XerD
MRIEQAAEEFLQYLDLERGCTARTVRAYGSDVRRCIAYLDQEGIEPDTEEITTVVMRQYVSWMAREGYKPATIARRVSTVSSMCNWLIGYGHGTSNPCRAVALPKKRKKLPAVLTLEEARRLLAVADQDANPVKGFRNRAVIATLLFCGVRRSELLDLKLTDVDLQARWLKVQEGKGMKGRSIPLLEEPADAIGDWLEFRPQVDHDRLFVGIAKHPLGIKGLYGLFKRAAERAGVLHEGVTLHSLRHTFASLLLQQGCNLMSIKEMMGHADLSTTAQYLHLDAAHLQWAMQHHPLGAAHAPMGQ